MLLDIYYTLITDNRNQYNVTNIDKQLTYVKQTIYRLSDRTVKYEIYLQTKNSVKVVNLFIKFRLKFNMSVLKKFVFYIQFVIFIVLNMVINHKCFTNNFKLYYKARKRHYRQF